MPAAIQDLISSGFVVDLILGLLVVEAVAVFAYHRVTKRGIPVSNLVATLVSGAFLLLALRAALVGWSSAWIALFLAAAFAAHLADLRFRAKRR